MASYFEEERFCLGEKSNRMVTVNPFMGKLKVHIRQFYVNENGDTKAGKNGITMDLEEFEALAKLVPRVQDSIARYELGDTEIPFSPFELDLPVLDLDTVFLTISDIARAGLFQSFETKNFWIVNRNFFFHHHNYSSNLLLKMD